MKYLILIFIVTTINAKPFFSKAQIDCAKTENCMLKNYMDINECKKEQGEICYDIANCKPDVCSIQDVEVDNPEKPIYALKTDFQDCQLYEEYMDKNGLIHADDCRLLVSTNNFGTEENPQIEYGLCTDKSYYALYGYKRNFPDTFQGVSDDSMFAYCTKHLGYEKMIVKQLREDAALKKAKEDAIALKLAEEAAKQEAINSAKTALKAAQGNVDKLSNAELNDLVEQMIILLGE